MKDSEELYWVVKVEYATGTARSEGPYSADVAHDVANIRQGQGNGRIFATVVAKR